MYCTYVYCYKTYIHISYTSVYTYSLCILVGSVINYTLYIIYDENSNNLFLIMYINLFLGEPINWNHKKMLTLGLC
jgi:hypothetical protein